MEGQYATLKDVAERAGTTAATVSYILNGSTKRYVSEDMRRRVEAAAKELNYVKSSAASSLKGKKRKIIAVLVPQFANQMFTELVLGWRGWLTATDISFPSAIHSTIPSVNWRSSGGCRPSAWMDISSPPAGTGEEYTADTQDWRAHGCG